MCCILATSPLLLNEDIVVGYERLIHSDFSSIVPVVQFSYPILRSYGMNSEGEIYFNWPEYAKTRSQDLESAYHDSGTFYWHLIYRLLLQHPGVLFLPGIQEMHRHLWRCVSSCRHNQGC